jgi:hypothetical protein
MAGQPAEIEAIAREHGLFRLAEVPPGNSARPRNPK